MKTNNIPNFGPLQGVRVIHLTTTTAGPYCACRMADFGADVIWVENPKGADICRFTKWNAELERRNMRSICLDSVSEEGMKVLIDLVKTSDILIDSYKGGQMSKWGLSDEKLHEINPKLIIVHISGYGQTGIQEYVEKACYDPISQAFSGFMIQNGMPDKRPVPCPPGTADYVTALQAAYAAMAALYRREKTGVGESIDVAQFESMVMIQAASVSTYLNTGRLSGREGEHSTSCAGYGSYTCKDGNFVYMLMIGFGPLRNALALFGLSGREEFAAVRTMVPLNSPGAPILEDAVNKFCSEHTAEEVEKIFNDNSIPCSRIFNFDELEYHPHYVAREVFTEWENTAGEKIKGYNVFPKMSNNPGKVWRGIMKIGEDTGDILEELGYSAEAIADFQERGIAVKK